MRQKRNRGPPEQAMVIRSQASSSHHRYQCLHRAVKFGFGEKGERRRIRVFSLLYDSNCLGFFKGKPASKNTTKVLFILLFYSLLAIYQSNLPNKTKWNVFLFCFFL
jgi:hypothetical protein